MITPSSFSAASAVAQVAKLIPLPLPVTMVTAEPFMCQSVQTSLQCQVFVQHVGVDAAIFPICSNQILAKSQHRKSECTCTLQPVSRQANLTAHPSEATDITDQDVSKQQRHTLATKHCSCHTALLSVLAAVCNDLLCLVSSKLEVAMHLSGGCAYTSETEESAGSIAQS